MSDQAPEAPARSRGRENVFTRRIGPLPMWQWLLIGGGIIGVYVIYEYRKNAAASSSATSTGGTTNASQVPQFVNQVYTYGQPPAAQQPPPGSQATSRPQPTPSPSPGPASPAPLSMPAASSGTVAATAPNIKGKSLGAAIAALQQAGWGIGSVSYAGQQVPASQYSQYASTSIVSFTPYSSSHTVNIGLQ